MALKLKSVPRASKLLLTCLLTAVFVQPAISQTTVFTRDTLNQTSLINALLPRPDGIKTRGISWDKKDTSGSASVLITFVTNSAAVTPAAQKELDIIAGALQANELSNFSFFVEGHADPRGPDDYNMSLSQRRAESVVQYLADVRGVAPERLIPVGKGETEQLIPERPAAPENRRVTIKTRVN